MALERHIPVQIDYRIIRKSDGAVRWVHSQSDYVKNERGQTTQIIGVTQDITERKFAEEELTRRAEELARSNIELERFAYVASHDLQEPLRAVASFAKLLARRHQDLLDASAQDYIDRIVKGTIRMQTLITDLLTYSRVGRQKRPFARTDCSAVLRNSAGPLKMRASVTSPELSSVASTRTVP